jgi:cytoskeletal protein CcmA (bactofilin family)
MFSSKTKDPEAPVNHTQPTPAPAAHVSPQPQTQTPKRTAPAANRGPSLISADLTVTGTLASAGDMQIDGTIEGDVRCTNLVIGEGATIKGEVVAEDVVVRGKVEGSIRARKVQLCTTCHVEGNILHETFAVESGAFFEGNCRHSDNPLSDDAAAPKMAEFKRKPAPAAAPSSADNGAARPTAN